MTTEHKPHKRPPDKPLDEMTPSEVRLAARTTADNLRGGSCGYASQVIDSLLEQLEASQHALDRYHEMQRERDALATQIAHEWGWPDSESVLIRLTGDRTAALVTFTEEAVLAYLGASSPATDDGYSERASDLDIPAAEAGWTGAPDPASEPRS